jgi:hypothetical protein
LWAGSWAARGKIKVSGILNCLNYCVIFIVYITHNLQTWPQPGDGDQWSAPLLEAFRTGLFNILEAFQFNILIACSLLMQHIILDTQEFYILFTIVTILKLRIQYNSDILPTLTS